MTERSPAREPGGPGRPGQPTASGTERLAVRDLAVDLGGRAVLRDVALQVSAGELVGLAGPNGAGKTTLLRAVLGLTSRRGGQVRVDGASGRAAAKRIGYVPQRHGFAWDFPISIEDAVVMGRVGLLGPLGRPRARDFAAALRALDRVGMADLRKRPVGELSGGQRQRVLVARALALEPRVLLLDEPFTGLDMPTQELLTDLFATLRDQGEALLMTTHDLPAAMLTCDRVVLLNRTVVADGPPDSLRDKELWMRTFDIGPDNPLLHALGVAA